MALNIGLWEGIGIGSRLLQGKPKIDRALEIGQPLVEKAKPVLDDFLRVWPELEQLLKEIAVMVKPEWQAQLMKEKDGGISVGAEWIQQSLTDLGFDTHGVDNEIGPNTLNAIARYQKARGLKPDKWIGPETLERIGNDMVEYRRAKLAKK